MRRVLPALPAELVELQPARRGLFILGRGVVAVFALSTLQRHNLAGHVTFLVVYFAGWTAKPLSGSTRLPKNHRLEVSRQGTTLVVPISFLFDSRADFCPRGIPRKQFLQGT
jgi:hypothetical protein